MIRIILAILVLFAISAAGSAYAQTAHPPRQESKPPRQQATDMYSPSVHLPGNVLSLPGIVTQNPNNVLQQGVRFNQVYPNFGTPIGWIDNGATLVFRTPQHRRKHGRVYVSMYQPQPNIVYLPNGDFSWNYYQNNFSINPVQQVVVIYPETYSVPINMQNLPYSNQVYYSSYPFLDYNCYLVDQIGSGYVFDQFGRCVGEIHRYPYFVQDHITVEGQIGNVRIRFSKTL